MRRNIYTRKNITNLIKIPGIYYNENLGLISYSVDGQNWKTIADKNLGATQVYNYGDVMTEANCGKYYQWGNNYGFSFNGADLTSSIQVDASNYGPGNYYSSDVFITTNPRDLSDNHNIWGGISGLITDRQGPCPNGWHIPNIEEWEIITDYGIIHGLWDVSTQLFSSMFKIPKAGFLDYHSGGPYFRDVEGIYQTTTRQATGKSYILAFSDNHISPHMNIYNSDEQSNGFPIRPFKNTPVQPDITRTVLHQ